MNMIGKTGMTASKKESIANAVITDVAWRRATISAIDWINSALKGIGIIGGVLLASLADWVLGAISLQHLFTSGLVVGKWTISSLGIASALSFAAWGIQLLIWDVILSGQSSRAGRFFLYMAIFMIIIPDTISDSFSLVFLTANNSHLSGVMPIGMYNVLFGSALMIIVVLTSGAEFYIARAMQVFRIRSAPRPTSSVVNDEEEGFPSRSQRTYPNSNLPSGVMAAS
jgi:hypothetical protein